MAGKILGIGGKLGSKTHIILASLQFNDGDRL